MTLYDVGLIFGHWKRNPPLRLLVAGIAAALGMKLPEPASAQSEKKYTSMEEFQRLVRMTGGKMV